MSTNRGKIISLVARYGFIEDAKGISHYFNQRNVDSGDMADLTIGDLVEFSPKASPRGMVANNVRKVEAHYSLLPGEKFLKSKGNPLRTDETVSEQSIVFLQSTWHRSPTDARTELENAAYNSGANALADISVSRETFRDGNYHYTMHMASGNAALYFKPQQVDSAEDVKVNEAEAAKHATYVREKLIAIKALMDEEREKQEQGSVVGLIIFALIAAFFVFLLFGVMT